MRYTILFSTRISISATGHAARDIAWSTRPTRSSTPSLNNRYVIIKNGMTFKKRWRHMFEKEDGPSDEDTQWQFKDLPTIEGERRRR